MLLEKQLETLSQKGYGKALKELSNEEVYAVLLHLVKDLTEEKPLIDGERKVYYFSAEFLIGKLMSYNLINLDIFKYVKDIL